MKRHMDRQREKTEITKEDRHTRQADGESVCVCVCVCVCVRVCVFVSCLGWEHITARRATTFSRVLTLVC